MRHTHNAFLSSSAFFVLFFSHHRSSIISELAFGIHLVVCVLMHSHFTAHVGLDASGFCTASEVGTFIGLESQHTRCGGRNEDKNVLAVEECDELLGCRVKDAWLAS